MGKIEFANCQDVRNQKKIQELDCPRCHEPGGIEACCIITRWDGRTIVLISPSITVMEMAICGGPVWMLFCLCVTRILCRDGGTRKFQPFLFARRERMEFICMT